MPTKRHFDERVSELSITLLRCRKEEPASKGGVTTMLGEEHRKRLSTGKATSFRKKEPSLEREVTTMLGEEHWEGISTSEGTSFTSEGKLLEPFPKTGKLREFRRDKRICKAPGEYRFQVPVAQRSLDFQLTRPEQ